MAVVVDDFGEAEYVVVVKDGGGDEGTVDRENGVTVVHESLVSQRWHRQAFLHITWHDPREEELVENETGIHLPRVEVRAGILGKPGETMVFTTQAAKGGELTSRMCAHIS